MKLLTFPLLVITLINTTACSDATETYTDDGLTGNPFAQQVSQNTTYEDQGMSNSGPSDNKVVMHRMMDQKRGMEMARVPLPASWKIVTPQTADDPNIIGPDGIKAYLRSGGMYNYSQDPYMQQMYQQSGQQMRAPISAQQIMQQDLSQKLNSQGLQMVKQYSLPQVAERSKAYSSKLFKSMPSQEMFDAHGSEWVDNKGNQMLVIVDVCVSNGQGSSFWYYQLKMIEAPKAQFQGAKDAFINGIVNTQDNPQQLAAYNAEEQQKTNQSWSAHNAKMKRNQQAFDQQQATHRSTSDAINNSITSTYRTQQQSSDRMQNSTINGIYEEETVTNPYDGQQYQIESGSNQTWMNSGGEYIQSDDAFYNPNGDNGVNNQDWQEVQSDR